MKDPSDWKNRTRSLRRYLKGADSRPSPNGAAEKSADRIEIIIALICEGRMLSIRKACEPSEPVSRLSHSFVKLPFRQIIFLAYEGSATFNFGWTISAKTGNPIPGISPSAPTKNALTRIDGSRLIASSRSHLRFKSCSFSVLRLR
jgi:hypothetical protein